MDYLQEHPLYVVAIIAGAIWVGIFLFMMMLSGRVAKLEKESK
jgi:CcmD family protein